MRTKRIGEKKSSIEKLDLNASERLCRENFLHQALQEYAQDVLAERLKAFRLDTDRVRQAEVT